MKALKRIVKGCILLVLLCAALVLGLNFYVILSAKPMIEPDVLPQGTDADYVLVLGCGVRADGSPSHMLYERLKTGAAVLERCGKETKLLLSGDNSGNYNELKTMKRVSLQNGVPEERIVCDDFGFSTFESLRNAKEVFGASSLVIITQPYHMYRAVYIAKQLGLSVRGVTADLPFYPMQIWWSTREVLARDKDALQTMLYRMKTT